MLHKFKFIQQPPKGKNGYIENTMEEITIY